MSDDEILELIAKCAGDLMRAKGEAPVAIDAGTVLFGPESAIDSLDLVNIIVKVEEAVLDKTGKEITVVTEAALIRAASPLRTVGSLAKLVAERISGR